jgi:hypothetical protein
VLPRAVRGPLWSVFKRVVLGLLDNGLAPESIVVVDTDPGRIAEANRTGLVGVVGGGRRRQPRRGAGARRDRQGQACGDQRREPGAGKEPVLAVIRGSRTLRYDEPAIGTIQITDRLVVVRSLPENRFGGRTSPPYRPGQPYRASGPERP